MSKTILIMVIFLVIVGLGSLLLFNQTTTSPSLTSAPFVQTNQILPTSSPLRINYQAAFLIFTNGTKRIFTDSKYHNRSEDVFITAENPSIVAVKKAGVTWGDFFATLPSPMKVEKTCLYTGTGQIFCNSELQTMKFFVNGQADSDALIKEIKEGDRLLISFGPKEDPQIENQLDQLP